jgi:hypothetical protein
MKKIAQSTGLLAIGGAIAACLALSPGQLGPQAYARDSVAQARRVIPLRLEDDKISPASQMTGGCDAQSWFDLTPREFLEGCGSVVALPASPADVNRDGIQELFSGNRVLIGGGNPIVPLATSGIMLWSRVAVAENGASPIQSSVAELGPGFAEPFIAALPDLGGGGGCTREWRIWASPRGWLDADGDGDLDLVLLIEVEVNERRMAGGDHMGSYCSDPGFRAYGTSTIWLQNIGFETESVMGDLDGDGAVGGGDVALLLLNWSE